MAIFCFGLYFNRVTNCDLSVGRMLMDRSCVERDRFGSCGFNRTTIDWLWSLASTKWLLQTSFLSPSCDLRLPSIVWVTDVGCGAAA